MTVADVRSLQGRNWKEILKTWAKAPSETEETKGDNAARMINDALRAYPALAKRGFEVRPTGSYHNNTNVRLGSDVDVAVVLTDAVFSEWPSCGVPSSELLGFNDASYGLTDFRRDVEKALRAKFGANGVTPGNITFNVHENSYRLDADVTPFCEHRRYTGQKDARGGWHYYRGAETRPVNAPAKRVINWHEQHYDEGVARNGATGRRFKRLTRIMKKLRADMLENGTAEAKAAAKPMASFLLECLVFNATDGCFNCEEDGYYLDTNAVITQLWNSTKSDDACNEFVEVSRLKWLFRSTQPWTRTEVHEFLLRAWQHIGFKATR